MGRTKSSDGSILCGDNQSVHEHTLESSSTDNGRSTGQESPTATSNEDFKRDDCHVWTD